MATFFSFKKYLFLFSCILLVACEDQTANIGQQAPDLAAFDLQGQPVKLKQWQGKPLLLSFWSETCGVCLAELKTFQQLQQQYPNHLQLLAINVDGENADTQSTVQKRELSLPIAKDQLKISAERYQVKGTPTSFVIDPQGKILYKFEGLIPHQDLETLFKG